MQVWKQRLVQMGGRVVEKLDKGSAAAGVNHVLAMDAKALLRELDAAWLHRFRGVTAARPLLPIVCKPYPPMRKLLRVQSRCRLGVVEAEHH